MGRNRKADRELKNTLDAIKESSQRIAENTGRMNEKLDDVKSGVSEIEKSATSKLPIIIAIIALLVTISGVSVVGMIDRMKAKTESDAETVTKASMPEPEPEPAPTYEIYLYPEYSTFDIGKEVDMTATLNFETDAVSITAYLASGETNTVELGRKNAEEWQKKVYFNEVGVHEVVVTALTPNGEVIKNSIEVEVTPISIDMDAINKLINP
ncbi:MAG: hypothetical protein K2P65_10550 [Lachnospiraceae bacterium]|nr:hypothetical protein [Lachnospiraceae bacterium]